MVDDPAQFSSTYEDEFSAQLVKQLGLDEASGAAVVISAISSHWALLS